MEALQRAEAGISVADLCRELGVRTAAFYKWGSRFGGINATMMSRLEEIEEDNRRLRRVYVEEKLQA